MNENWARWIYVSALKHFQAAADAYGIHMFIEGTHRDTQKLDEFIEFRTDGPQTTEICHNCFRLDFEINILFQIDLGRNFQRNQEVAGWLASHMTNICVHKHGDGDDYVGKLSLRRDRRRQINQFGQIRADLQLVQGTVEGTYRIYLSED